jgi:hypothetical protein
VLLVSGVEIRAALKSSGLDIFAGLADIVDGDLRATYRPGKDAPAVFALVRPDGVLAARGSRRDARKVLDYLRQISATDAPEPADPAHLSGVAGSHECASSNCQIRSVTAVHVVERIHEEE